MENLIDIMQLSTEEIDELVKTGCDIMELLRSKMIFYFP